MAEVRTIIVISTGEALVKGCLKYPKGFDTAETGMDVTFEMDIMNTRVLVTMS